MDTADIAIFDNLLESTTDGICIIGYDGIIRMENSIASGLIGEREELTGRKMSELISEGDANDDFFECIIDAVFSKERVSKLVPFYRNGTKHFLRLVVSPLSNRDENIAAIVVFSEVTELMELARKNEYLTNKLIEFIDRFVKMMVNAIDKRSHYNANHTKNMVRYATNYLDYLEREGRPIDPSKREPFLASVWMHDVGKLLISMELMDKPTRLGDAEKDLRHRTELAIVCEKLKMAENPDDAELCQEARNRINNIESAMDYILSINTRGLADDEMISRVNDLADIPCLTSSGDTVPLLGEYEREALTVSRGTLTAEERRHIQSHVVHTYDMLKDLGLEGPYKDVPKWAGGHHEFLDGSGYPNEIGADDLTWETRLLTIIDIYDALTAEDRPYKPPLPAEKTFGILREMCQEGKLDSEILEDFIISEAWK